ncbi:MAG: glycogen synthase GlgA [Nitrospinae bacterium]|nr:glycogen synthase GlgA [Nitrospinota bacterium]
MKKALNILIASPEVVPFAKTGGLADVTGALPRALRRLGHNVSVILPRYQMVNEVGRDIRPISTKKRIHVPISARIEEAEIYESKIDKDIPVYFIDKKEYYSRPQLYGTEKGDYPDNAERFIYFSRAILETCKALDMRPDIIHCNDWQTGILPVYLKTLYKDDPFFQRVTTVYTIHNIGYQGIFWHYDMHLTNLGWDIFTIEGIEFYGNINLMKGGILFSDIITTVSKTYSKEIQTEEYGYKLDGVLRKRNKDLYGVINGIDYEIWHPLRDKFIKERYSEYNLSGKDRCKRDLMDIYKLTSKNDSPIVGIISRLADQKGFDLISEIIDEMMRLDMSLVLLGTGTERYNRLFEDVGKRFSGKAGIKIGFDDPLAHKIEAGADIFLMPSRYEPCGLNQLYSLKYGTIPIVRSTGGLNDTIEEFNIQTGKGNGFKFREYSSKELLLTLKKAINIYKNKKDVWKSLMKNAMKEDFSWENSANEYVKLYRKALSNRKLYDEG